MYICVTNPEHSNSLGLNLEIRLHVVLTTQKIWGYTSQGIHMLDKIKLQFFERHKSYHNLFFLFNRYS